MLSALVSLVQASPAPSPTLVERAWHLALEAGDDPALVALASHPAAPPSVRAASASASRAVVRGAYYARVPADDAELSALVTAARAESTTSAVEAAAASSTVRDEVLAALVGTSSGGVLASKRASGATRALALTELDRRATTEPTSSARVHRRVGELLAHGVGPLDVVPALTSTELLVGLLPSLGSDQAAGLVTTLTTPERLRALSRDRLAVVTSVLSTLHPSVRDSVLLDALAALAALGATPTSADGAADGAADGGAGGADGGCADGVTALDDRSLLATTTLLLATSSRAELRSPTALSAALSVVVSALDLASAEELTRDPRTDPPTPGPAAARRLREARHAHQWLRANALSLLDPELLAHDARALPLGLRALTQEPRPGFPPDDLLRLADALVASGRAADVRAGLAPSSAVPTLLDALVVAEASDRAALELLAPRVTAPSLLCRLITTDLLGDTALTAVLDVLSPHHLDPVARHALLRRGGGALVHAAAVGHVGVGDALDAHPALLEPLLEELWALAPTVLDGRADPRLRLLTTLQGRGLVGADAFERLVLSYPASLVLGGRLPHVLAPHAATLLEPALARWDTFSVLAAGASMSLGELLAAVTTLS